MKQENELSQAATKLTELADYMMESEEMNGIGDLPYIAMDCTPEANEIVRGFGFRSVQQFESELEERTNYRFAHYFMCPLAAYLDTEGA